MESTAPLREKCWIKYDAENQFPLENIPFGAYEVEEGVIHACTRIGDSFIDLHQMRDKFSAGLQGCWEGDLNKFMGLGQEARREARKTIQDFFMDAANKDFALQDAKDCEPKMVLPCFIRDYTDFYSSRNHAYNIGVMFRGVDNAFQPNYFHLPVGYHGRASSIVKSGTEITRPKGQTLLTPDAKVPTFNPSRLLDMEIEMGTFIGKGNKLGAPIHIEKAQEHIFGHCLLNDWSSRDIQKWEYVPLGPFLAKNFASTISCWIITTEALAPFKIALPAQEPALLPYLQAKEVSAYDIDIQAHFKSGDSQGWHTISKTNMKHLYYSAAQTVAHHAATGCNMSPGDLLGSGTISAPEREGFGSLVELSWAGKHNAIEIALEDGTKIERKFLKDGDELNFTGVCRGNGFVIGFGDCSGKILPAVPDSAFYDAPAE
jgi:fumarylacetoacetase